MTRLLLVLLLLLPRAAGALDLDAVLARSGLGGAEVAVLAEPYAGGAAVLERGADAALPPASTQKLMTAIGVLERFGPDARFATRLLWRGEDTAVLVGGGDPELDLDGLMRLALALKDTGQVPARLVFDDGLLPRPPSINPSQPQEDAYNAGVGALNLAFNRVRVVEGGTPWTLPPLDERGPAAMHLFDRDELPVRDAGLHAARTFRRLAGGLGLVLPEPVRGQAFRSDREVGRTLSKTVGELVRDMLLYSNNQIAETLGLAATGGRDLAASASSMQAGVAALAPGATLSAMRVVNHSGLAYGAAATPRQLLALLRLGQERHGLLAMLPVSGWSGSLEGTLRRPETALRVWAKTGSLDYALGLAGLLLPESGRPLLVALLVADPAARRGFDRVRPTPPALRREADAWARRARALRDDLVAAMLSEF